MVKSLMLSDVPFWGVFRLKKRLWKPKSVENHEKVQIFEKKVQKNLEVKKKVVPLQPV